MKGFLKYSTSLLMRILFILVSFFFLQNSIILVSACPVNFGQNYHTGISETYTYDAIESSILAEVDRTSGLSRVLSVKGVRPDHEVLVGVSSVAAKGAGLTLKSASQAYKGTTRLGHALSKHAGRNPQIWGKIKGNPFKRKRVGIFLWTRRVE